MTTPNDKYSAALDAFDNANITFRDSENPDEPIVFYSGDLFNAPTIAAIREALVTAQKVDVLVACLKEAQSQVKEICTVFKIPIPEASFERYDAALNQMEKMG